MLTYQQVIFFYILIRSGALLLYADYFLEAVHGRRNGRVCDVLINSEITEHRISAMPSLHRHRPPCP